ncbi:MAG: hypothetical protein ACJA0F_001946, partial [Dinoroseobacter sp.]
KIEVADTPVLLKRAQYLAVFGVYFGHLL